MDEWINEWTDKRSKYILKEQIQYPTQAMILLLQKEPKKISHTHLFVRGGLFKVHTWTGQKAVTKIEETCELAHVIRR